MLKHGGSTTAETSLSAPIRFDSAMADAIDSFSLIVQSSLFSDRSLFQCDNNKSKAKENYMFKSNKGGTIPEDSLPRMKHLLPTAASSPLTSCLEVF